MLFLSGLLYAVTTRQESRWSGKAGQALNIDTFRLACMLGGPEGRTLFISTTASLDPSEGKASGRIETIQVDVPGAGLP